MNYPSVKSFQQPKNSAKMKKEVKETNLKTPIGTEIFNAFDDKGIGNILFIF